MFCWLKFSYKRNKNVIYGLWSMVFLHDFVLRFPEFHLDHFFVRLNACLMEWLFAFSIYNLLYQRWLIWLEPLIIVQHSWLGQWYTPIASLQRNKNPSNECPGYSTKRFDSEAPVMLELWAMRSISSLPSLPGQLWPAVVAPDSVLSMGQIELFDI